MKKPCLKNKILELRSSGLSYDDIAIQLDCSKGTISYHCGEGQREKYRERRTKNRKNKHPLFRKIEAFHRNYYNKKPQEKKIRKLKKILYQKIVGFSKIGGKDYNYMNFSIEDLLKKIGDNPCCCLTGRGIDLQNSKTYHLDHIVPISRGGDNSLNNCQVVCSEVNFAKYNLTQEEFIALCREVVNHCDKK